MQVSNANQKISCVRLRKGKNYSYCGLKEQNKSKAFHNLISKSICNCEIKQSVRENFPNLNFFKGHE